MSDERPDDQPMSIGEHLEELRRHVLKGIGWTVLALVVCLAFQHDLLIIAEWPHKQMVEALRDEALAREAWAQLKKERVQAVLDTVQRDDALAKQLDQAERHRLIARERARPATAEAIADLERRQREAQVLLAAHTAELQRLAAATPVDAAALDAAERALAETRARVEALRAEVARDVRPLLDAHASVPKAELVSLAPTDVFLTAIKLCFVAALFVAAPLIVWEMWKFVSRALYPHERKWVRLFGPLSYGAFLTGFMFGYLVLIPVGLQFLGSYAPADVAVTQYSVQGYMSLLITLSLVCGVIFELPLIMSFLAIIGLVTADGFRGVRKYWVLGAFVVAGILTPPDPFTQSMMAIPLLGLYEVGILLAALVGRRAEPPPEPDAPALGDAAAESIEDRYPETPLDEPGTPVDLRYPETPLDDPAPSAVDDAPALDDLRPRPAPEGTVPLGGEPAPGAPPPPDDDDLPPREGTSIS